MRDAPDEVTWRRLQQLGAIGHREAPAHEHHDRAAWEKDNRPLRSLGGATHHRVRLVVWDRTHNILLAVGSGCGKKLDQPTPDTAGTRPCRRCYGA